MTWLTALTTLSNLLPRCYVIRGSIPGVESGRDLSSIHGCLSFVVLSCVVSAVALRRAQHAARETRNNGEVVKCPIPGRPRISAREEDAMLLREVENHPFRTASQLKMASNSPGSPHTVRRRFRERGIRCRRTVRREHLAMEYALDRLAYATLRQDFYWRNVIFSDEIIVSSNNDGLALVYRMDATDRMNAFNQRGIEHTRQQLRVHHSTISYLGVRYAGPSVLCADDPWFTKRPDIDLVDWPPKSPGDELWDRFLDAWEEVAMNLDLFHNLVDSMPRRMRAFVDAGGLWTRY
ncbi:hypothetical protein ANN_04563 [Periplaneta americana]|uniref:Transposase Tc1-like domain-containing protein n=1 Tax=Periplaneta americana TaxID=6978 RepID=A0ABQ8T8V2_PERAM|nr:hypothetical protein ANN_04563 [Periplaneta americana]